MKATRRGFVTAAAAAAVPASGWQTFTEEEVTWLEALVEQIIPADQDPGGREAGCAVYIDRQVAGPLKRFLPLYRDGLQQLRRGAPDFLKLDFAAQTAHLKTVESTPFFQMLVDHTMQGYYGDPRHGGNRGMASWKMLKIDKHLGHGPWQGHTHEVA
jgi:gluconate 2-dehydrogenase gamma chain